MKKFSHVIMLLWGLSITGSCLAQNSDYKWLQGEWKNDVYGDIADIYPNDSIRFLKNGLVFSEEEIEYDELGELPTTIDDLKGHILFREKFPYEIGSWHESIANGDIEALLFECRADEYPYEPISTYLGIDNEQKQLFYYSDDGEKVVLTKTSELVYEEQMEILEKQMQIEVEEKNKNLPTEIAAHEFDWLHGQWELDMIERIIVNIDEDSVKIERGNTNDETGGYEIERTESFPINIHYRINNMTREIELLLVSDDLFVDKENKSLFIYHDFDFPNSFEKVSEYTHEEQMAIAQKEAEEWMRMYKRQQIIHYSIWAVIVIAALALLFFIVRWIWKMLPKIKVSIKNASEKTKKKVKTIADNTRNKIKGTKSAASGTYVKQNKTVIFVVLLGLYITLFFDLIIGLIITIPALVFLIISKKKPEKTELFISKTIEKLEPIISRPLLKRGIIAVLIGLLLARIINLYFGLSITALALVFLAIYKFAPQTAQKIDDKLAKLWQSAKNSKVGENIKRLWQKKGVRIATYTVLIILPFFIRPSSEQNVMTVSESYVYSSITGEEVPNNGDYSNNYHKYIKIDMRHERSFGLDIYIENLTGQPIREVIISFNADGHTEKMFVSNLRPYQKQNKLLSYFGDYYPRISKVVINWK